MNGRSRVFVAAATAAFAMAPALVVPSADASVAQDKVVSASTPKTTPHVNDGQVHAIVQVGNTMVVGGTFSSVSPPDRSTTVARSNVFAFDAATGSILPGFAPAVNGEVDALLPGVDGSSVLLGGKFTTVDGAASKSLARLSLATGTAVAGFTVPALDGVVNDLDLSGGRLFVGGTFTKVGGRIHAGIATLNPTTGSVDPYMNVQLAGHHNWFLGSTGAKAGVGTEKFAISPDGTRIAVIGNFKTADGLSRDQLAVLNLGPTSASVDANWRTTGYVPACASKSFDSYVRNVDFAPDGSYFVVVATGAPFAGTLCDSAAAWPNLVSSQTVAPRWVDWTGGDSLYSVAATGTAVYVGGHERWMNNPLGHDSAAAGAVPRPGLAALDPVNGVPLSWNPGRNPRGAGTFALYATPTGLWMGSDTTYLGNRQYYRGRLAFFPLATGSVIPPANTGQLPGTVYTVGRVTTPGPGQTVDDLLWRSYDGATAGTTTTVSGTGVAWGQARGAFMVNGTLFYGYSNGSFYRRSFDGTTLGVASAIDPYNDPYWSTITTGSGTTPQYYRGVKPSFYAELPNVTGMFFLGGRIYYALSGQSALYSRAFTPDSGITAETRTTVTSAGFADVAGMFVAGGKLYYAARSTGTLHRVDLAAGVPVAGTDTVVNTATDWRGRGLFLLAG